jgi:hypothetical protein
MAGKKISQLSSGSLASLPLTGLIPVVHSGVTYQHTLSHLRQILVDSGSHVFTGSQVINGDLTVSGSLTAQQYILSSSITNIVTENISGSSNFGNSSDDNHVFTGSMYLTGSSYITGSQRITDYLVIGLDIHTYEGDPEALHVSNTGSYNIAHFQGNNEYYSQINITNLSSGSNSSTDLVLTADNGTEGVHFIDLGINSSTYTGGLVGRENDAYLLNVGKDMYIGTVGGAEHPSKLFLFGQNNWENPQITVSGSGQVSFNTCSCDPGYTYQFSGSAKMQNELNVDGSITASHFVGDGSQLTNLPIQTTDVSMFLSSSTFTSASASFDSRIIDATNEQDLSYFATTGSNVFSGNQIIDGTLLISGSGAQDILEFGSNTIGTIRNQDESSKIFLYGNDFNLGPILYLQSDKIINNGTSFEVDADSQFRGNVEVSGSVSGDGFNKFATTGSNTFVGNQIVSGTLNIATNSGDEGGEITLGKALTNTTIAGNNVILDVFRDRVRIFEEGGSSRGAFLNVVSQSANVNSEIVTSPNLFSIQTITSASYASITPVSGTLYIIID